MTYVLEVPDISGEDLHEQPFFYGSGTLLNKLKFRSDIADGPMQYGTERALLVVTDVTRNHDLYALGPVMLMAPCAAPSENLRAGRLLRCRLIGDALMNRREIDDILAPVSPANT